MSSSQKNIHAIVMAGGEGKRMNSSTPKVLHCVGGKPMIYTIVKRALSVGIDTVYIVCGKFREEIIKSIDKPLRDEFPHAKIIYVTQPVPLGTGDAIKCCLPHMKSLCTVGTEVVIINGDTPLINNTLTTLVEDKQSPCLMVTRLAEPFGQGRIVQNSDDSFEKIVEEKDADDDEKKITLVNCGVYKLSANDLFDFVPRIENNNAQNEYYLTDVCGFIKERLNLYEVPKEFQFELLNVNTQADLARAEEYATTAPYIAIRRALPKDYASHVVLYKQLSEIDPFFVTQEKYNDFLEGLDNTNHHIFVAVTHDKVVGTVTLFYEQKLIHNMGKVGHIEDVVVDKSFRGKQLGKDLIGYATRVAIESGCYKVILDCAEHNVGFYKKCGYDVKGSQMAVYSKM